MTPEKLKKRYAKVEAKFNEMIAAVASGDFSHRLWADGAAYYALVDEYFTLKEQIYFCS